jgi:hypothetical protein
VSIPVARIEPIKPPRHACRNRDKNDISNFCSALGSWPADQATASAFAKIQTSANYQSSPVRRGHVCAPSPRLRALDDVGGGNNQQKAASIDDCNEYCHSPPFDSAGDHRVLLDLPV